MGCKEPEKSNIISVSFSEFEELKKSLLQKAFLGKLTKLSELGLE